jgi:hypothetical protein
VAIERHTERTIVDHHALQRELEEVRRRGYALVDQELEEALRSVAVPLRARNGRVVAALNVGTHTGRVGVRDLRTRILPELQTTAAAIDARGNGATLLLRALFLDLLEELAPHLLLACLERRELIGRQDGFQLALLLLFDRTGVAHLHELTLGPLDHRLHLRGVLLVDGGHLRQLRIAERELRLHHERSQAVGRSLLGRGQESEQHDRGLASFTR